MSLRCVLIALWIGVAPLWACAAEAAVPTDSAGLIAYLGTPTRPERAAAAWEAFRDGEADVAVRLASALGRTGGVGALDTLGRLMRDRDAHVRLAATRAAGRLALRARDLVKRLRDAIRWRKGSERRAAVLALSRVGDGSDVDTFLGLALDDDEMTALTAYRALVRLTDRQLPPVHARWAYWWRSARRRAEQAVTESISALDESPEGPEAVAIRTRLLAAAWVRIPQVAEVAETWLRASNEPLRLHALTIVRELGLSDLGRRVERVRRFERDDTPVAIAADETLRALGLLLPPVAEEEVTADLPAAGEPIARQDPGAKPPSDASGDPVPTAAASLPPTSKAVRTMAASPEPTGTPPQGSGAEPTADGPTPVLPLLLLLYATGTLYDPDVR